MKPKLAPEELLARRRERDRVRYWANRDAMTEKNRAYHAANKEQINARCRSYHVDHREEILRKDREYNKAHSAEAVVKQREYRLADPEKAKQADRVHNERYKDRKMAWRELHRDRLAVLASSHARANAVQKRTNKARRRAALLKAIPPWADIREIKEFYLQADRLTKATGVKHEVDHIVPLQNKFVCGLHCHSNLQVITQSQNRRKHNTLQRELVEL